MTQKMRAIIIAAAVTACAAGCSRPPETPPIDIVRKAAEANAGIIGTSRIDVRVDLIANVPPSMRLLLGSEDGSCAYTVVGHRTGDQVAFEPDIVEDCRGRQQTVKAVLAPRNKAQSVERCQQIKDERDRLQCVMDVNANNEALSIVVTAAPPALNSKGAT